MKTLISVMRITPVCLILGSIALAGQTIGVRTLAIGDVSESKAKRYLSTPNGYQALTFLSRHPGRLMNAYTSESLVLYEKFKTAEKSPEYRIVDKVKLPEAAESVLLLALVANDEQSYLAIDANFLEASYDTWLMINTTSKPIFFKIGSEEEPFQIEPNNQKVCKITLSAGSAASVLGQAKLDDTMKTFYSTYWPIREGERSIIAFFEQGSRIRVRKISDALMNEKEADAPRAK